MNGVARIDAPALWTRPVCRVVPRRRHGLFLLHIRKAGGTSLREFGGRVAGEKGWRLEVVEDRSLDWLRFFGHGAGIVHMISLRHPIERIRSAYRFDGRWRLSETNRTPENAKPLKVWLDETRCAERTSHNLHACTENYYVKSLIGYPRNGADGVGREELEVAKRRLEEFEIVLITEWLSSSETGAYLRQELATELKVPFRRYPEPESSGPPVEEMFDDSVLARLEVSNRLDLELYEHARRIVRHRFLAEGIGEGRVEEPDPPA